MEPNKNFQKNPEKNPQKPTVETFASDMAKILENDQGGLIKKIIDDEEAREKEKKNLSPESRRNKMFLILSICMLLSGASLLIYFWVGHSPGAREIAPEFTPLIFTDKSNSVETSGLKPAEIIQSVLNQTDTSGLKPNAVVATYLTGGGQQLGLRQFLALFKMSFVPDESLELVSDSFLMGRVNVKADAVGKEGEEFFILLKVRSAVDIFDSLRAWEEKMFYDLHDFFGVGIASGNNYLLTKDFEDSIVENKNTRVLTNKEGNMVFQYVFADNNSVVITDSTEAVREIILRLGAKQIKE
ncbi:MAG: hypothetical protein M3M85_03425 [bacterium]|nr:hypothetical protein [bacterium]